VQKHIESAGVTEIANSASGFRELAYAARSLDSWIRRRLSFRWVARLGEKFPYLYIPTLLLTCKLSKRICSRLVRDLFEPEMAQISAEVLDILLRPGNYI